MACSRPCSKAAMQTFVSAGKSLFKPSLTHHLMVWMTPWYCSDEAVGLKSTHHLKMPTTSLWFGIVVMFCKSCSIGCLCAGTFLDAIIAWKSSGRTSASGSFTTSCLFG
jgi:hypothetical protein